MFGLVDEFGPEGEVVAEGEEGGAGGDEFWFEAGISGVDSLCDARMRPVSGSMMTTPTVAPERPDSATSWRRRPERSARDVVVSVRAMAAAAVQRAMRFGFGVRGLAWRVLIMAGVAPDALA